MNWWNSNAETPERAGLYDYIYNGGDYSFAQWSIDFFIDNEDVSWELFENWFMGEVDGIESLDVYDSTYWNNPNLIFNQQRLPLYSTFSSFYPDNSVTANTLCHTLIGGQIATLYDNIVATGKRMNTCAVRLSYTLNKCNIKIPNISGKTKRGRLNSDGTDDYYFTFAEDLIKWMIITFDSYNNSSYKYLNFDDYSEGNFGEGFKNDLEGKRGIYALIPIDPRSQAEGGFGATGHCDMFNGERCVGSDCYFQDAAEIFFWELH